MERVLIVAGKSGGHIVPGLAVGRQRHADGDMVAWVGEARPLDRSLLAPESWLTSVTFLKLRTINTRKIWLYPLYAFQLLRALIVSLRLLHRLQITQVISMGGYVSVPVCFAAWVLRIPYVLYELNAELGKSIALLAPCAQEVRCCFEQAMHALSGSRATKIAYPLSCTSHGKITKVSARQELGLAPDRMTLMVIGGSQGSRDLNELCMQWIISLTSGQKKRIQMIHQTGQRNSQEVQDFYERAQVHAIVFEYQDLAVCYQAADFAITRAGAGVLHELAFFEVPALIIPLEAVTTAHQVMNAQEFVRRAPHLYQMALQQDADNIFRVLHQVLAQSEAFYHTKQVSKF